MSNERLVLAVAHQRLCHVYGVSVPYSRFWRMAVTGAIPVERVGSRWLVAEADLPHIAEALGLTTCPAAA